MKKWTKNDKKELDKMFKEKKTSREIGKKLGRSRDAVDAKIAELRLVEKYGYRMEHKGIWNLWTPKEDWIVWYYKNHTLLNNKEIGELIGRSKSSVNNRFCNGMFAIKPPGDEMPEEVIELLGLKEVTIEDNRVLEVAENG
ncbi:MAG: hypothetical protein AMQ22_00017 [Candidatus Methanofastidiosum methylothiophilum]|uniref:Uncharacterized protein n=1 Tax=Candidatus Methanofastidiosum methylothiophilum TaxID=1705564 RepID=A0A150J9R2_9EURY|nr:MAG: hypothetical protein AMQ22_00017 [Candidatus Methanofastidiosum methylthiophilus]